MEAVDVSKDLVLVHPDGAVEATGEHARQNLSKCAGQYRLVNGPSGIVILRNLQEQSGIGEARVLMAGELVTKTTVLDVVSMVTSSQWVGELHVYGPDSHRCLSFDRAALKYASSDVACERLGEMLVSRGIVTEEQLAECLKLLTPDKRLGHILVDQGCLTREELFKHLGVQTEQIFYSALLVCEGAYLFALPAEDAEPPAMTLHIPVPALLLEGVQRIDETALFRERIADGNSCPVLTEGGSKPPLDSALAPVAELIDGKRTILEIARLLHWDEFQATKAVYQLIQIGYAALRVSSELNRATVASLVNRFNEVIREIFEVVARHGSSAETRERLVAWVEGSGYSSYFGEELGQQGAIDPERVIATLERFEIERPLEALHQALHELAAFALFAATPELPRSAELALAKYVNQRLKDIRL